MSHQFGFNYLCRCLGLIRQTTIHLHIHLKSHDNAILCISTYCHCCFATRTLSSYALLACTLLYIVAWSHAIFSSSTHLYYCSHSLLHVFVYFFYYGFFHLLLALQFLEWIIYCYLLFTSLLLTLSQIFAFTTFLLLHFV